MLDLKETGMLFVDGNFICKIPVITNTKDIIKFNGITYIIDDKIISIAKNKLVEYFCLNIKFHGHRKYKNILIIQRAIKTKHNIDILKVTEGIDDDYWVGVMEEIHNQINMIGCSNFYNSEYFDNLSNSLCKFLNESKEKVDDIIHILASSYYSL